ncbi:type II toxin-antitoxin system PemK/MazF family toxin [Aurantimonas sp. VKM B-3413]|uniref:type II toxin-antitoxin system PemK/MazF family toxin n=1 Tax=Aurantimonas sp. VKM B-3413 TaxID=2779401 RepID=UPI001E63DEB1|nr:type II toxin-antitoxin system PemK/MazF family toxin [Aurantimonas sp. VKM B-3413]MCB8838454.1 type II toxin-antitoxin system PemK/MazF family toxin [Aurantimonas sp. VKM B-3413]
MRRGDVFGASLRGLASKPRPSIILHATEFIVPGRPVLVCPLTSELSDAPMIRVDIEPSEANGLQVRSQAMIDRLSAALPQQVGLKVGHLEAEDLARIEFALINVLSLQHALSIVSGKGKLP